MAKKPEAIRIVDLGSWFYRHLPNIQRMKTEFDLMMVDFPWDTVKPPTPNPQFLLAEHPQFASLKAEIDALPDGKLSKANLPAGAQAISFGRGSGIKLGSGAGVKALLAFLELIWPFIQAWFAAQPEAPTT